MEGAGAPPEGRRGEEPGTPGRIVGAGARAARGALRRSGADRALDAAVEEALVAAMESPSVERALIRLAEEGRLQQVIETTVARMEIEGMVEEALSSDAADRIWRDLLASDKAQMLVERVAEAPEVRAAIAQQGLGLIGDIGRTLSRLSGAFDDVAERLAHRLLPGRRERGERQRAGLVTRALAMAVDLALIFGAASLASALIASILPVAVGLPDDGVGVWALLAAPLVLFLAIGGYLVLFWSLVGQTPGLRFLDLRVVDEVGGPPGLRRSLRRLLAMPLAAFPLGAGFLAIVASPERRGWHDRAAGTNVVREPDRAPWSRLHRGAEGDERYPSG